MSKRKTYTDFIPALFADYESPKFKGVIVDIAPRKTAANGKEFISFQVAITEIFDETFTKEVGEIIWQMATPSHKLNGQWNVMKNAK